MDKTVSRLGELLALVAECLELAEQFTRRAEDPYQEVAIEDVEKLFRYMSLASTIESRYSQLIQIGEIPDDVRTKMNEMVTKVQQLVTRTHQLTVKWITLAKATQVAHTRGLFL